MSAPSTDRAAVRQIIRALKGAGFTPVRVWDGEENTKVKTETEILDAVMAVDESTFHVRKGDIKGCVFFVLGNDPYEVASDYTVNLEEILEPLFDKWDA